VTALVELLSYAGVAVRVDLVFAADHTYQGATATADRLETWIGLKDYGEALDMERLVYALAHPDVPAPRVRDVGAGQRRGHAEVQRRGSYGHPGVVAEGERGDLHIDAQWDADRTRRWVVKQLRDAGFRWRGCPPDGGRLGREQGQWTRQSGQRFGRG
jgi:hypothetical protein